MLLSSFLSVWQSAERAGSSELCLKKKTKALCKKAQGRTMWHLNVSYQKHCSIEMLKDERLWNVQGSVKIRQTELMYFCQPPKVSQLLTCKHQLRKFNKLHFNFVYNVAKFDCTSRCIFDRPYVIQISFLWHDQKFYATSCFNVRSSLEIQFRKTLQLYKRIY